MAVGDAIGDVILIAASGSATIKPGSGEWVVHNIYAGGACELYFEEAVGTSVQFDEMLTRGAWNDYFIHCTTTHYLRVANTSGTVQYYGYDGIITKA